MNEETRINAIQGGLKRSTRSASHELLWPGDHSWRFLNCRRLAQPQSEAPRLIVIEDFAQITDSTWTGDSGCCRSWMNLVRYPEIQTEIKMTDAQKKKFADMDPIFSRDSEADR